MHVHLAGVVGLVDVLKLNYDVHAGVGGLRRTNNHTPRAAEPQTPAPMATAPGTPSQCERAPASMPPTGIMPPNTSAQMPMTRPRMPSATPNWIKVLVVEK